MAARRRAPSAPGAELRMRRRQASGHELDAIVGLHDGDPDEPRAGIAVEVARAHEGPGRLGQRLGQHPGAAPALDLARRRRPSAGTGTQR